MKFRPKQCAGRSLKVLCGRMTSSRWRQLRLRSGGVRRGVNRLTIEFGGSYATAVLVFHNDSNGSGSLGIGDDDRKDD